MHGFIQISSPLSVYIDILLGTRVGENDNINPQSIIHFRIYTKCHENTTTYNTV